MGQSNNAVLEAKAGAFVDIKPNQQVGVPDYSGLTLGMADYTPPQRDREMDDRLAAEFAFWGKGLGSDR